MLICAGSSVAERGLAMAEAWVQFPIGACSLCSGNSMWQSAGLPNRECGFKSRPLLLGSKGAWESTPTVLDAAVAQTAEHRPRNAEVAGSTPACGPDCELIGA
jgi:hypothetical protein